MNKECKQHIEEIQTQIDYQVHLGKNCDMERLTDLMTMKQTLIDAQLTLTILRGELQIERMENFLSADNQALSNTENVL